MSEPQLKFIQSKRPALLSGDYKVTFEQDFKIGNDTKITPSKTAYFKIEGDRFSLKGTEIFEIFPPAGNFGDYQKALPHIVLNRSTLPWERTPTVKKLPDQIGFTPSPSWMALLLFDEIDAPEPKVMKLGDLGYTEDVDENVTTIIIKENIHKDILPTLDDLKFLSHTRIQDQVIIEEKNQVITEKLIEGPERATILCNRLPVKGRTYTAHLVSMEDRYTDDITANDFIFDFDLRKIENEKYVRFDQTTTTIDNEKYARLVSLKSWTFSCSDPKKSFKGLLTHLNQDTETLRMPIIQDAKAEAYLKKGYVPLRHEMRYGHKTVSFYRGPFIPGYLTGNRPKLPVTSADALVRFYKTDGLFDVSYAAAWEHGRMLMLANKELSSQLYKWKVENNTNIAVTQQKLLDAHFFPDDSEEELLDTLMPPKLDQFFQELSTLQGVAFNYLVADEAMLPEESIRFFTVDPIWIDCLLDGAFSIGDDVEQNKIKDATIYGTNNIVSGFFLRSEVVEGWPGLFIDGFSDANGITLMPLLRRENLAKDLMLVLFEGEIKLVDFYLAPGSLHFGIDGDEIKGEIINGVKEEDIMQFKQILRNRETGKEDDNFIIDPMRWRNEEKKVMNVFSSTEDAQAPSLVEEMTKLLKFNAGSFTSANFALQMMEGGEKIRFTRK